MALARLFFDILQWQRAAQTRMTLLRHGAPARQEAIAEKIFFAVVQS